MPTARLPLLSRKNVGAIVSERLGAGDVDGGEGVVEGGEGVGEGAGEGEAVGGAGGFEGGFEGFEGGVSGGAGGFEGGFEGFEGFEGGVSVGEGGGGGGERIRHFGGVRWGGSGVRGMPTAWQAPCGPGAEAPEEAVASR
jgi:hypothetical protein